MDESIMLGTTSLSEDDLVVDYGISPDTQISKNAK